MLDRRGQLFHQSFLIARPHIGGGRRVHPFGVDPRAAQHAVNASAARLGDDDDRGALLARAAGAARPVLVCFGRAPNFAMTDEAEPWQRSEVRRVWKDTVRPWSTRCLPSHSQPENYT